MNAILTQKHKSNIQDFRREQSQTGKKKNITGIIPATLTIDENQARDLRRKV